MKKMLGQASATLAVFALSALPALAGGRGGHGHGRGHSGGRGGDHHLVPEIDASTGLLALAALLAAMVFVWELRRRRLA